MGIATGFCVYFQNTQKNVNFMFSYFEKKKKKKKKEKKKEIVNWTP